MLSRSSWYYGITLICLFLSWQVHADFESLRKHYLESRNRDPQFSQETKWIAIDQQLAHFVEVTIDHQHRFALAPESVGDALVYRAIIAEGLYMRRKDPELLIRAHAVLARMVRLFTHHSLRDDALLRRIELYRTFEPESERTILFTQHIVDSYPNTPAWYAAKKYVADVKHSSLSRARLGSAITKRSNSSYSSNELATLGAPIVLIDPGHGGDDTGARGARELLEKDITLAIARELKKELERRSIRAILTRDSDEFVPLARRTEDARRHQAHILVSIHCNASVGHGNRGIEFYVYDRSIDTGVFSAANHGGAPGSREHSNIADWLAPLVEEKKRAESDRLAGDVREVLSRHVKDDLHGTELRIPRKAGFYVLQAVTIPGVLIELLFVDEQKDGELLSKPIVRSKLAKGIADGIQAFFKRLDGKL
jgi:N-acetylmuramoyl-L-alanine amidase